MKRFQMERPLMVRRWRQEWESHDRDFGNCHCGRGIGTMRKRRPYEGHPPSSCGYCAYIRLLHRLDRRRERYAARAMIAEGLEE